MKLNNFNKKLFGLSFSLICTSVIASGCTMNESDDNSISYNELIDNYKVVEFTSFDKQSMHIVKKEEIKDMPNCYGYYDIYYHNCIIKVDEEKGIILGKGIINNIVETDLKNYLEIYNINQDKFSKDDLGIIIDMIRKDYFEEEKVLVK